MSLRVSLVPKARAGAAPRNGAGLPPPLLDPRGARVILGAVAAADGLAAPIVPAAGTLFGPRGACLGAANGPLFVSDTGHHRLLVWRHVPDADGTPADVLIGQPAFDREGRNGKGEIGAATLNVPTGIAAADGVLAVADAWNHRVLIWHGYPDNSHRAADVVLGQADFAHGLANRGEDHPRADTLNWCYGVAIHGGRLFVADTGNRRVLMWNAIPTRPGQPADLVIGQVDVLGRDENAGAAPDAHGMRWPHAVAVVGQSLLVADAGNNRIMLWHAMPRANGTPCDLVLGQSDVTRTDNNQSAYYPTATALNMPYGLAVSGGTIIVADTANSRLLGYEAGALFSGCAADRLSGQPDFANKGDNRWGFATRDSVCWPYGVSATGQCVVIADSGNNRILLWERAT